MIRVPHRRQGVGAQRQLRLTRDRDPDRQELPRLPRIERLAVAPTQVNELMISLSGSILTTSRSTLSCVRQERDRARDRRGCDRGAGYLCCWLTGPEPRWP